MKYQRKKLAEFESAVKPDSVFESLVFGAEMSGAKETTDLHGLDVNSAENLIDQALYRAVKNGGEYEVVEVVHGRGSGTLRKATHKFLSAHPLVEYFRDSQDPNRLGGSTFVVVKTQNKYL